MVERKWIGGSCHNIACLPSKNVIYSAKVASLFGRTAEFGIETGAYSINMEQCANGSAKWSKLRLNTTWPNIGRAAQT
jgi:pyruvate/2-oxoglutarate dehydrogenase complex dihydrolipoamide dehydrogenase (E3) component